MGSRSRIFAPKTHLPLNLPPAPQPETMADGDVSACFDAGNSFNTKLKDALSGLVKANNDRKSEIDALRGDHDQLKKDHDALEVTTTRENDLRKNEIKSLEEKQTKDNTARQMDIAKLDGKLDTENGARKAEIAALDSWAKGENDARKTEIANLKNFAESENDGRKADIAALNKRPRHRHRHLHLPLWRNLHVPVPHRHPRQQEGSAVHPQERRGGRLHLRPEPQGQPQELDGWAEHHHRREARRRDRGVCLHRHLARRLPHEPLHPLGWTPAEAKPGGARPDEEGG